MRGHLSGWRLHFGRGGNRGVRNLVSRWLAGVVTAPCTYQRPEPLNFGPAVSTTSLPLILALLILITRGGGPQALFSTATPGTFVGVHWLAVQSHPTNQNPDKSPKIKLSHLFIFLIIIIHA